MWQSRIERIDDKYYVVETSPNGREQFIEADRAHSHKPKLVENFHAQLNTDFSTWEIASADQYASIYAVPKKTTKNHLVYLFKSNSTTIFVPSWVLQRGLFSPSSVTFKYLYSTNGLEFLCQPYLNGDEISIRSFKNKVHSFLKKPSGVNRMTWFHIFPSAYRTWKSVYAFAREGRIGIELPKADVTCAVHGKQIRELIFLNTFHISKLRPAELPLKWVNFQKNELRFTSGLQPQSTPCKIDSELSRTDGTSSLSDVEWSKIEDIAMRFTSRPVNQQRQMIDEILDKLTKGKPWRAISHHDNVSALYVKMMKDGRWQEIRPILISFRKKAKKIKPVRKVTDVSTHGLGRRAPQPGRRIRDTELLTQRGHWETSHVEWRAIEGILSRSTGASQTLRRCPRLVIDSIIKKMGTGKPWSAIASSSCLPRKALQRIYQKLNTNGCWAEIRSVLCNVRANSASVVFSPGVAGWRLSDAEWQTLQSIVTRYVDYRPNSRRRDRLLIDCMVEKLGTGKSWAYVAQSYGINDRRVRKTFAILKSDGRWQYLCSVLCKTRGMADPINVKGDSRQEFLHHQ